MNLRQVEVFLSVVQHGSFSGAARQSNTTQSTISIHIAALEQEVGIQLLERSRNGVRLTEGGHILHRHARRLMGELRATEAAFRRFRGLEEATLRIGASTIPAAYLVPPVLRQLCDQFPRLDVVMVQGDSRETMERITSRDIEIGVVGTRADEKNLAFEEVGHDRIQLVVPSAHPWAGRTSISISEIEEGVFIAREAGSGTGRTAEEALRSAGIETGRLRVRVRMGTAEAIKGAVMAGIGVAFLSELSIRREAERGDLVVVPVENLEIARPFYVVRLAGRDVTPASMAFREAMLAAHGATVE